MYCLDTDLVISFIRNNEEAISQIQKLRDSGFDMSITTLTLCELYRGAYLSSNQEENLTMINGFIESVNLLVQNIASCLFFGKDYALLKRKGSMTQEIDLMIASVCKANHLILVTRNIKDFKNIPNLLVEKW